MVILYYGDYLYILQREGTFVVVVVVFFDTASRFAFSCR